MVTPTACRLLGASRAGRRVAQFRAFAADGWRVSIEEAEPDLREPPAANGTRSVAPEKLRVAIDQHAAVIYRLALSIVRDPALADDVVQETLIKAWRAAPLDPSGAVPRAWMTKVARNTAISMLRSRREEPTSDDRLPERPTGLTVARAVEGRAALSELRDALDTLDEDARALVVLREIDGMSYEDIAAAMDLPLSTVKTRLFRARQSLKRALEAWQ
jgi:RNA polymerase sigma-70 factor, ECF subfamily